MSRRHFLSLCAAAVTAALLAGPAPADAADRRPSFQLTDQDGRPVTEADFRGRHVLVYFGYTFCPDACPIDLSTMAAALDALAPEGDAVLGLFVSVDPGRDTPATLREYVSAFHPRLRGATGEPAELQRTAQQFGAKFKLSEPDADGAYLVSHTTTINLLGPDGIVLARFRDAEPQTIADAVRRSMTTH